MEPDEAFHYYSMAKHELIVAQPMFGPFLKKLSSLERTYPDNFLFLFNEILQWEDINSFQLFQGKNSVMIILYFSVLPFILLELLLLVEAVQNKRKT